MLSFLSPYLAKIGIGAAIIAAVVGAWLYVARLQSEIKADVATIAMDSAKCANTQLAAAATQNAATAHAVQQAEAQANAAEAQLQAEFKAGAASATITDATITEDAATPGQDTPVAPVLANLNKALEAGQ